MSNNAQNQAQKSSPAGILRRVLIEKIARNPAYSLRAYARDLGVSHAYLSYVMAGKRKLSLARATQFGELLALEPGEKRSLVDAAAREALHRGGERPKDSARAVPAYYDIELDRFRTLADWYHIAILDLTMLEGFRSDARWVAKRLGIRASEVRSAVVRLSRLGLLDTSGPRWTKTHRQLEIPTYRADEAIRSFHEQMIQKALTAAQSKTTSEYAARDITGITMAIDPAKLPQAKKRIQRFRRQMDAFLSGGQCTELYQLNVQLFRLTRPRRRGRQ